MLTAGTPLRTGPGTNYPLAAAVNEGTILEVTGLQDGWYRVTVTPDLVADSNGPRVAYVLSRLVAAVNTTDAVGTSVSGGQGQRTVVGAPIQARSDELIPVQSSDGSVGWCTLHYLHFGGSGVTTDACVAGSASAHIHGPVDFALEASYVHALDLNMVVGMAGIRVGGPPGEHPVRAFGEFVAGPLYSHVSEVGSGASFYGFALQPGIGVDVHVSPTLSLRPTFGVFIQHVDGVWAHAVTFSLSVAWRSVRGSRPLSSDKPQRAVPVPTDTISMQSVTIIDRQDRSTDYTYVVPGFSNANSRTNVNCVGGATTASCSGSTTTTGLSTPAMVGTFQVTGATLSLQLLDGRIVVVNCDSKFAERLLGPAGNHRSCRVPLVNAIQVEFDRDNAKLIWPVSLDGQTMQSEIYRILAVLDKPAGGR